jgi:hypothetical protein
MSVASKGKYDLEAHIHIPKHKRKPRVVKWMNLNDTLSFSDVKSQPQSR